MVVIEYNLDVIKNVDYIIDLGLDGGYLGGYIVGMGILEELVKNYYSYIGRYLKDLL